MYIDTDVDDFTCGGGKRTKRLDQAAAIGDPGDVDTNRAQEVLTGSERIGNSLNRCCASIACHATWPFVVL